jgi:hypothetical protein
MLKPIRLSARLLAASAMTAVLSLPAFAAELELKRVMLSSGGVGYFEYQAQVEGWETLEVPVRLDQVDDVLKSAIIFDDAGGSGVIELQGKDSLTEIFRTMPVGAEAFESPAALYAALKGEVVTVDEPVSATGQIVSVVEESETGENGMTRVRHRMAIMTDSGLVQFILEDARGIRFANEALDAKLKGALTALASNRERELRTLKVTARGDGYRTVTIGFVIEAPLWKTSYRMVMGGEGKARMQGWAVIENASGADWKDVELTLVSGNPVTFKQALYDKYYVDRESVPVEVLGRVTPRKDEGSYREESNGQGTPIEPAPAPAPMEPAGPAPAAVQTTTQAYDGDEIYGDSEVVVTARGIPDQAGEIAAESEESATQVVFTMANAVTAGSGQSLTVPILDREVPGERIAYFQPGTHASHPLAAIKLTNATDTGLPPGIVTLFDNAGGRSVYSGDAVISVLPVGESRIVSYALDQKVLIDVATSNDSVTSKFKIATGILETTTLMRRTVTYTVKGASNEDRQILIETPRIDWDLMSHDPTTVDVAGDWLRLPMSVSAGQTSKMDVVWEQTTVSKSELLDLNPRSIEAALESDRPLPEHIRAAFVRMGELHAAVSDLKARIKTAEKERTQIASEQERIRKNLASVPEGSDLQRRYLATLAAQEDRLIQIEQELAQLEAARSAAEKALEDYVASLNL